jgi:hypothetical protein
MAVRAQRLTQKWAVVVWDDQAVSTHREDDLTIPKGHLKKGGAITRLWDDTIHDGEIDSIHGK